MKIDLNQPEHDMLRKILSKTVRSKEPLTIEQLETLCSLHEKICLYWMNEEKTQLEEALKTGLTD